MTNRYEDGTTPPTRVIFAQLRDAQEDALAAGMEKVARQADKLQVIRDLLQDDYLQTYLTRLANSQNGPVLSIYNDGATITGEKVLTRDYTIPNRHSVISFRFDDMTGHTSVLLPDTHNYDDPPVLGGPQVVTPVTTGRSIAYISSSLSLDYNERRNPKIIPGFRFYDLSEIEEAQRPRRLVDRFRNGQERQALVEAAGAEIRLPFLNPLDQRPILRRRKLNGQVVFDNLASDENVAKLDQFDMGVIVDAVVRTVAAGR